ncbi:MAG TPA: hypothetical protein VI456_14950 [Polyangia bacterium]
MAEGPADETARQSATRPGGSWFAGALALLAWCIAGIAVFAGTGEPMPGPDYERALAHKALLARSLFGAALVAAALALILGLRARANGRPGGLIGVFVGGAFLACTALWWLAVR